VSQSCVFCNIDKHRVTASDELTITVLDKYPISPGHTLIIPRRHCRTFFDATNNEQAALINAVNWAKEELDKEYSPDGYNIGINNGVAAGQTVGHLHIHLIPRYEGDVQEPKGGVRWIFPDKADYWSNPE